MTGCRNSTEPGDMPGNANHALHEDENKNPVIHLNNGAKWQANPETTEGIHKMVDITNQFPTNASLEDYHLLKTKMEEQLQQVFDACTMSGEAHAQLHNYLLPLGKLIEYLSSKDIEFCSMSFQEIKEHLAEYGNYFE
jgi:hypothetical protein